MPSPFIHKMPPKPSRKAALPKPAKKGRKRAGARKKKATTGADDLMADIKRDLAFAEADRLQDAVRAKFRKFDADSSGFIDMQEMSGIMQELGFVDTDGDSFSMFLDEEFKACDVRIARLRWHSPIVTPHPLDVACLCCIHCHMRDPTALHPPPTYPPMRDPARARTREVSGAALPMRLVSDLSAKHGCSLHLPCTFAAFSAQ